MQCARCLATLRFGEALYHEGALETLEIFRNFGAGLAARADLLLNECVAAARIIFRLLHLLYEIGHLHMTHLLRHDFTGLPA